MRGLCSFSLLLLVLQLYAVPARRQVFRALMSDGIYRTVTFCGDETRSYYLSDDGYIVEPDASGTFYTLTQRRPGDAAAPRAARATGVGTPGSAPVKPVGSPRIPVILVNFSDLKMTLADTDDGIRDYYDKFCNGTRNGMLYDGAGSYGAVRDYFAQQSDSVFLPEFTIVGPVTLSRPMAYYGQNSGSVKDIHFTEFCSEALQLAMAQLPNLATDFDNDNDGTVDLAFFIYAGLPESDSGVTSDAIWPKERVSATVVNGVTISVMACCSELNKIGTNVRAAGVGTMCHELAHSLGLPDEYDVNGRALGMSYWSLMDSGNYANNGYMPCGLTGYERDFLNWRPLQTPGPGTTVRLRPLETGGTACKIVNDAQPDEYYILENRAIAGWDASLARLGHGMLAVHVDYSRSAWTSNALNTDAAHQRMSFIPANGRYVGVYNAVSSADLIDALAGQPYPGATGNSWLTDESQPASTVFTGGFMGKPVTQIREMDNGDIVFKFMPRGVLTAPAELTAEGITDTEFTLGWQEVPQAECYAVEVYGLSDADGGEMTPRLVFSADTVRAASCTVTLGASDLRQVACRVMAMADAYEDSEFSDDCTVQLPASAVADVAAVAEAGEAEVYSLHGVRLGRAADVLGRLPRGLYVVRTKGGARKIAIP